MYASPEYTLGEDTDAYDDNDPSALTDFRQTLDPYGTWTDDPTYGTVWVPSQSAVGADFTPYATAGHWVYDDDYVWVSDYDWGWAPFHYGRWVLIDGRGWAWIPGRVYRGAWVGWGVDDGYGYVGWYPLAPPFLWFGGVAVGYAFAIGPRWAYCPHGEVFSPVVGVAHRRRAFGGRGRGARPPHRGSRRRHGAWTRAVEARLLGRADPTRLGHRRGGPREGAAVLAAVDRHGDGGAPCVARVFGRRGEERASGVDGGSRDGHVPERTERCPACSPRRRGRSRRAAAGCGSASDLPRRKPRRRSPPLSRGFRPELPGRGYPRQ